MTHDERIEEVARAIWNAESVRAAGRARCIDWLDVSERHRSDYIFLATAAFAAAGVEEMVIAAAPDMLQEIATLRAELAEAQSECAHLQELVIRQGEKLRAVVNALRGPPPPDTAWSVHDAPELAVATVAELAEARRDVEALRTERAELYLEQERLRDKLARWRRDAFLEKIHAARLEGKP